MTNNETHQYVVSFLRTQRGLNTQWIDDVLSSGLRDGETLDSLCITELEGIENELG